MTNNPTIDGVSREMLLNKCACGSTDISFCYESPQGHWILCDECGETSPSFENKGSALDHWNKRAPAVERQEPKASQVPVLRAMAANYRNGHSWDFLDGEAVSKASDEITALQSTIAQLQARIAELESGRGEADAWALLNGGGLIRDLTDRWDVAKHWDGVVEALYFAPPAQPRPALPNGWQDTLFEEMERRFALRKMLDDGHMVNDDTQVGVEFAIEWVEACLDATAALNGPAK
jgi:hypothetical protein